MTAPTSLRALPWDDLGDTARRRLVALYDEAFPDELSAPFASLLVDRMLAFVPAAGASEEVLGLALLRDLRPTGTAPDGPDDTGWTFLRYFAVGPRGAGVGSAALRSLADLLRAERRTVLAWDVEDPDEPGVAEATVRDDLRRIAFYERNGATLLPAREYRPPHEDGSEPWLRMMALPLGPEPLPPTADLVRAVLLHRYGCPADHPATRRTLETLTH